MLGSIVYGATGYSLTFVSFALVTFLAAYACHVLLPAKLNLAEDE
jgi:hypothetical protein